MMTHGATLCATARCPNVAGTRLGTMRYALTACSTAHPLMSTLPSAVWCSPMAYISRYVVSSSARWYVFTCGGHDYLPYTLRCLSPAARRMGAGGTRITYAGPTARNAELGAERTRGHICPACDEYPSVRATRHTAADESCGSRMH